VWTWGACPQPVISSTPGNHRRRMDPQTFHVIPISNHPCIVSATLYACW
jgi:hypothetical protein